MDAKHFPQIVYLAVHIDHLIFPIVFSWPCKYMEEIQ